VPLLAVSCTSRVKKRCGVLLASLLWLEHHGSVDWDGWVSIVQQPASRPGWGSNNLTTWGEGFFLPTLQHFSVLFLERTCWCTVVSQMLNLNSASNLFAWTAWVSNVALPSSPWVILSGVQLTRLSCLLWLSIRLFLLSQVHAFHFNHSLLTSYLLLSLENNMALAETSSFYTTLRLLYAGWSSNAYQPNTCGCRLPLL